MHFERALMHSKRVETNIQVTLIHKQQFKSIINFRFLLFMFEAAFFHF